MLTDRQNKFFTQIIVLTKDKTMSSEKERIYLKRAVKAINEGMKFQLAINDLNYNLKKKVKENKNYTLSIEVEKLSNELIDIYGEPVFRMVAGGGKDIPINPLTY
jgi:hypothetical protein